MAVILLGNELGAGLGHAKPLRAIAEALMGRGHSPVLAVPDLVAAAPALRGAAFPVIPAPLWRGRLQPRKPTRSFADVLADKGFADPSIFGPIVMGWQALIAAFRPALVIADHSPALCLTARGMLPAVAVGVGFTVPPGDGATFPDLVPEAPAAFSEERLLALVNRLQQARGRPALAALPEIFPEPHCFPLVHPEIDPYRAVRSQPAVGPLEPLPPQAPAALPDGPPRVFAYLSAGQKSVGRLLADLAGSGIRVEAYLRDSTSAANVRLRAAGVDIHDSPVPLPQAVARSHLFLSHGNLGSVQEVLAVGRPQLCLPIDLEKRLIAAALEAEGVGVEPAKGARRAKSAEIVKSVHAACLDADLHGRAQALAARLHGRGRTDNLSCIAEHCDELIGR